MKITKSKLRQIIKEETQKLLCEAEKWTELKGYGQALANRFDDWKSNPKLRIEAGNALAAKYPGFSIKHDPERDAWVGAKTGATDFRHTYARARGYFGPKRSGGWWVNTSRYRYTEKPIKPTVRRPPEPEERATGAKIRLPPHRAHPRSLDPGHEEELKKLDSNK